MVERAIAGRKVIIRFCELFHLEWQWRRAWVAALLNLVQTSVARLSSAVGLGLDVQMTACIAVLAITALEEIAYLWHACGRVTILCLVGRRFLEWCLCR